MVRLIQLLSILCFPLFVVTADDSIEKQPIALVKNQNVMLTDDYIKQAYASSQPEVQDAVISNSQRFQKYIENRWVELNLINQVNQGIVPDDMPNLEQLLALIDQTSLAKLMIEQLAVEQFIDLDETARNQYQKNLTAYRLPTRVKASHILIKTEKRSDNAARILAEKVREKVISGMHSFSDLALKYSDDPSVQRNKGDLGFFGRGQMTKSFEDAAFSMDKSGEISPIVKTRFGYHIIRFEEKQEGKLKPFSVVQKSIKDMLLAQRQQQIWKQYKKKVIGTKDRLVSNDQVKNWLWFGGIDDYDESKPQWKQILMKLSIAKLLANQAKESSFDQHVYVKQKLASEKRKALVKLRRRALVNKIAKRDLSTVLKEQYLAKKDQYVVPIQADISMIFLSKKTSSNNKLAVLANSIHQQLSNGKATFEELALKYSDVPDVKKSKGHMVLRKRGAFGKKLDAEVFEDEKPGLKSPIDTPKGMFIVNVNEFIPQHQQSFDEVKASLTASIVNELATKEFTRIVESMLNNPENTVNLVEVERLYAELIGSK